MNLGLPVSKQSLLNLPVAGDVDTALMPGWARITGLVPMNTAYNIVVTETVAVTEVKQEVTIGGATTITVAASTKYQIKGGNTSNRVEGAQSQLKNYGYTAPAVLSGSASVDRQNLFAALAYKIMHDTSSNCWAFPLITVAQTNTTAFTEGEIVTETVSGATGVNVKTKTGAAAGTTGTLTIGVLSGTWSGIATGTATAGTLVGSGVNYYTGALTTPGLSTSTAHVTVGGIGLVIIDKPTYFDVEYKRFGKSTWMVTQTFIAADMVTTIAAVYGEGQGTEMLAHIYRPDVGGINRVAGEYGFANNQVPVAGTTYSRFDVYYNPSQPASALSGQTASGVFLQRIYAYDQAAGFAAFRTAILAL